MAERPPLRTRGDDVQRLAEHVLAELSGAIGGAKVPAPAARESLDLHRWPGNVRELEHVLVRAFILSGERIGPELLALRPPGNASSRKDEGLDGRGGTTSEVDRILGILTMATRARYEKKKEAADVLGSSAPLARRLLSLVARTRGRIAATPFATPGRKP